MKKIILLSAFLAATIFCAQKAVKDDNRLIVENGLSQAIWIGYHYDQKFNEDCLNYSQISPLESYSLPYTHTNPAYITLSFAPDITKECLKVEISDHKNIVVKECKSGYYSRFLCVFQNNKEIARIKL